MLRRLEGRAGPDFLDAHELHHAINVTEVVGAIAMRGPRINLDVEGLGAPEEIETGFQIMSDGPNALRRSFQDLVAKTHMSRLNRFAPRATFGAAYVFFAGVGPGRFPQPAREVFREVLFDAFPYEEGLSLDGEPGSAPTTIKLDRFAPGLKSALTSNDLPDYLGCSPSLAKSITQSNLIPRVVGVPGRRRVDRYRREDIDRFMGNLMERASSLAGEKEGWLSLIALTRRMGVCGGEVIEKVFSNDLNEVRHIADRGRRIDALRFCSVSVGKVMRVGERDELSAAAAARALNISARVLMTLIGQGWGDRGIRPSGLVRSSHGVKPVFRRDKIEAFRCRYVAMEEEARKLRLFPREAISRLEEHGVFPAFPPGQIPIRLYAREARFFRAIGKA